MNHNVEHLIDQAILALEDSNLDASWHFMRRAKNAVHSIAADKREAWVDLLKAAEQIVKEKFLYKRFIDGTPLANDIPCWMATFAQEHATPPAAQPAPVQEPIKPDTLSLEQLLRAAVYWGATYAKGDYHDALEGKIYQWISLRSGATPPAQPAPVPDYAWPTVADYENFMGFEVNEAFRMAWAMARTTNPLFTRVEKNK